jgi:raffinose/stachyose/melibiose transport system permease protein
MTETSIAIGGAARAAAHEPSGPRPGVPASIALYAALIVLAGVVLVPILATALNGFKEIGDLQSHPFAPPRVWVWKNYSDILTGYRYWQVLGNSLLIALLTVALTLALSSMAAFTFAHLRFFGDRFLLSYLQLGLLFPLATAIPPLFIKIRDLGLLDTYWGVILPQVAFSLAMSVLLLRNAFRQLPGELLDAAMMDGCGYFRFFFYITLPLSGPILSTVAVISFVASWNGFLLPLVVLNTESRYPWTLGMMVYQGQYSTSWQLVLSFITLTILPAIVMFLMAQRYIVAGLTAGAVKA